MTARMFRCVATLFLLAAVSGNFIFPREKRQVTYHADEYQGADKEPDVHSVRPVTKKPLPIQLVYPGDLSNFFTTEAPKKTPSSNSNRTSEEPEKKSSEHIRQKRGAYIRDKSEESSASVAKTEARTKALRSKYRRILPSESRLHASYHKPSVSVMNDIPAEMYFDGAGFLRHEDDSEEVKNSRPMKMQNSGETSRKYQDTNQALRDFRAAFNMTNTRTPTEVKFDDDVSYQNENPHSKRPEEKFVDHGAQGTENGTPLGIDFMNAYQHGIFENAHQNYATQIPQNSQSFSHDPFSFTYPGFYNGQPSLNQIPTPVMQQESLLQNHRIQSAANVAVASPPTMYSSIPQQAFQTNPGYSQNQNYQQFRKIQRKKRSTRSLKDSNERRDVPAQENQQHYRYSRIDDQEDSSSGFIPITGSFNGGTIHLNFPFYGSGPASPPSYSSPPVVHKYHTYSVPMKPEGRHYRGPMERYYHPSEARRYSYGILGSGNFEVIRGGVFPNDRHVGLHGGYQDGRIPYGGDDFGNYGTTEIIIDGPVQGFQGFDNFPVHLINALSKHSELAVRPERSETEILSS